MDTKLFWEKLRKMPGGEKNPFDPALLKELQELENSDNAGFFKNFTGKLHQAWARVTNRKVDVDGDHSAPARDKRFLKRKAPNSKESAADKRHGMN